MLEVVGEEAGIVADAFEVGAGFRVAGFGEFGEGEDREVAGVEGEDSLGGADADGEFGGIEGLGDEFVGAGGETGDGVGHRIAAGEEDDVDVAGESAGADGAAKFEAGHDGHFPIGDDEGDGFAPEDGEGFAAVVGLDDLVAHGGEGVCEQFEGDVIVVDDENPHGCFLTALE